MALAWYWIVSIVAGVILGLVLIAYLYRLWIQGAQYRKKNRTDGKVALITGANTGIGKETAIELAKRGAKVYIACRSVERGKAALEDIRTKSGSKNVYLLQLDLGSFKSIRSCANEFLQREDSLHLLINNAGVMACPPKKTEDGLEMQIGTNHMGHFLLTMLLLDTIKRSAPARIVNVSSIASMYGTINQDDLMSENNYTPWDMYCQSKLANVLFTKELARRLKGTGVTTYSLHPGAIDSDLSRHLGDSYGKVLGSMYRTMSPFFLKTPKAGAQTTLYCTLDPEIEHLTGSYFSDCKLAKNNKLADDVELCQWLWQQSEVYTKLAES